MRIARQNVGGIGYADLHEHAQRLAARRREVHLLVQPDRFGDLLTDGKDRVQRRHRLLEDHRDLRAADRAHRRGIRLRKVDAIAAGAGEFQHAGCDAAAAVLDQPHQRQRGHRFAGARFADDSDRFAASDLERNAANRLHDPLGRAELDRKPGDRKRVCAGCRLHHRRPGHTLIATPGRAIRLSSHSS